MKIVLRAVLRAYELRPDDAAHEPARRRNITVRPGRGSRVSLKDDAPGSALRPESGPTRAARSGAAPPASSGRAAGGRRLRPGPPFFSFTLEPVTRDRAREVGLVADQQHLAAARGQLQRVEVAAARAGRRARPERPAPRRRARRSGGPGPSGLVRQASSSTPSAFIARPASRDCRSPFSVSSRSASRLARAVLGVAVSQQPDHRARNPPRSARKMRRASGLASGPVGRMRR